MNDIKKTLYEHISKLANNNLTLKNEMDELNKKHEKAIDDICCECISVLDTFEKAEQIIKERGLDEGENAQGAIKRLLNAKKKTWVVLQNHGVELIEFPDNMSVDECCTVCDTEPDSTKETGYILSMEKYGYRRHGKVIRPAEVVIVKN